MPILLFLVISWAHMNLLFIIKVKTLFLIEPRMVDKLWARSPISFKHIFLVSVHTSKLNHTLLNYRCPFKMSNWIFHSLTLHEMGHPKYHLGIVNNSHNNNHQQRIVSLFWAWKLNPQSQPEFPLSASVVIAMSAFLFMVISFQELPITLYQVHSPASTCSFSLETQDVKKSSSSI